MADDSSRARLTTPVRRGSPAEPVLFDVVRPGIDYPPPKPRRILSSCFSRLLVFLLFLFCNTPLESVLSSA